MHTDLIRYYDGIIPGYLLDNAERLEEEMTNIPQKGDLVIVGSDEWDYFYGQAPWGVDSVIFYTYF